MPSPFTLEQIAAARAALDLTNQRLDLEQPSDPGTDLYHLLYALIEWSDSVPVDFTDILSQVRADLALDARPAPKSAALAED